MLPFSFLSRIICDSFVSTTSLPSLISVATCAISTKLNGSTMRHRLLCSISSYICCTCDMMMTSSSSSTLKSLNAFSNSASERCRFATATMRIASSTRASGPAVPTGGMSIQRTTVPRQRCQLCAWSTVHGWRSCREIHPLVQYGRTRRDIRRPSPTHE